MKELPKRSQNRLTDYEYAAPNAYFITICTAGRKCIFWENVGAAIGRPNPPSSRPAKEQEKKVKFGIALAKLEKGCYYGE